MNKIKIQNFLSYCLIILIINVNITKSKIERKYHHPGSTKSSDQNIEIIPLDKNDDKNSNKLNNEDKPPEEKEPQKNNQDKFPKNDKEGNEKIKKIRLDNRDDDEFVYKEPQFLDLDKETADNPNNIHYMNAEGMNPNGGPNPRFPNFDPQKERLKREEIRKKQKGPFNQGAHRQHFVPEDHMRKMKMGGQYQPGQHGPGPSNPESKTELKSNPPSKLKKAFSLCSQILMIFFFISFIYNYFLGKNQNDKHALVWYNSNKEYFEERYEYFGLEDDDKFKKPKSTIPLMKDCKLIKENTYYYKLTCANYRYIRYFVTVLEFKNRYDVTSLLKSIFFRIKDRIIFQVSFEPKENVGWIFCVCSKSLKKSLIRSYEDIKYFCATYEPSSFNNYMCLLSENLQVFMELFDNKDLFHYYKNIENYLEAIYYSDQNNIYEEANNIFFSFNIDLTRPKQERLLLEITHFVNLFVDTLAQLKYTKEFKEELKKKRYEFEKSKMDPKKRKEVEDKERNDYIEKWRIKNKMRTKKGAERRKLERELSKYQ